MEIKCHGRDTDVGDNPLTIFERRLLCIQRAIEEKQANPSRAKVFVEMSNSELTHAGNLCKMLDEDMKKAETANDQTYITFLRDMQKEISKRYMKESAEVKYMHENFNK